MIYVDALLLYVTWVLSPCNEIKFATASYYPPHHILSTLMFTSARCDIFMTHNERMVGLSNIKFYNPWQRLTFSRPSNYPGVRKFLSDWIQLALNMNEDTLGQASPPKMLVCIYWKRNKPKMNNNPWRIFVYEDNYLE